MSFRYHSRQTKDMEYTSPVDSGEIAIFRDGIMYQSHLKIGKELSTKLEPCCSLRKCYCSYSFSSGLSHRHSFTSSSIVEQLKIFHAFGPLLLYFRSYRRRRSSYPLLASAIYCIFLLRRLRAVLDGKISSSYTYGNATRFLLIKLPNLMGFGFQATSKYNSNREKSGEK